MKIKKFFHKIEMFFRRIRWFYQRGKRGYADCDLWNFDTYLEEVLSKGLRDFAKTTSSYPDGYETFEDWKAELNQVADLVEKFNPDNSIDWEKGYNASDWAGADADAAIAREAVFDWFKDNWGRLWD